MTSFKTNYLLKVLPPNTITLGIKASTYDFQETQTFSPHSGVLCFITHVVILHLLSFYLDETSQVCYVNPSGLLHKAQATYSVLTACPVCLLLFSLLLFPWPQVQRTASLQGFILYCLPPDQDTEAIPSCWRIVAKMLLCLLLLVTLIRPIQCLTFRKFFWGVESDRSNQIWTGGRCTCLGSIGNPRIDKKCQQAEGKETKSRKIKGKVNVGKWDTQEIRRMVLVGSAANFLPA